MTDQWSGFTVSVRTSTGQRERQEGQASWQELPKGPYGHYKETLWEPESPEDFLKPKEAKADDPFRERVFVVFFTSKEQEARGHKGLAIVSRGKAEVYCGDIKLLSRETPIVRGDWVILIPGQAFNPGGRAEILFNQEAGQSVELQIKIGERTVKEVKIVHQFN